MRLDWADDAIDDLRRLHGHAPRQAEAVVTEVEWLVGSPFPGMYRRVEGNANEHVLVVAPQVVIYRVDGPTLTVLRVLDGRRQRAQT